MEKEKNTWVIGIIDLVSITLEPFLRKDFGERYFTVLKFLLSGCIFTAYFVSAAGLSFTLAQYYSYPQFSFSGYTTANSGLSGMYNIIAWMYILFILAYFILGLVELKNNFNRNKSGQRWHTYNSGTSRFLGFQIATDRQGITNFLGQNLITPFVAQLYFEPLAIFILGLVVAFFTASFQLVTLSFLACWLLFASIFMFAKGQIMYGRLKNQVLNARDSQIEGEFMEQVISGELTRPKQSDGLTAISLRPQTSNSVVQTTQDAIKRAMEKNPSIGKKREEGMLLEKVELGRD